MKRTILLVFCIAFFFQFSFAQVVMKKFLSSDHSGTVENSVNYNGETLRHEWKYKGLDERKIQFELSVYHGDVLINTFDLIMRDLIIALYIEIRMYKGEDFKTLTAVYDKGNKWMRIKLVPPVECRREGAQWEKLYQIDKFQQILDFIISQVDKNVLLECYEKK